MTRIRIRPERLVVRFRAITRAAFCVILFGCAAATSAAAIDEALVERLDLSTRAFRELMASPDTEVPSALLRQAEAVVIFPRTINAAWGIGGQYGKGVALRRDPKSGKWSSPAFYTLGGITIGPQIGGQAIDIVLVVVNAKGLDSLLKSKSTLGADAGVAVGPAGRNVAATTDLRLKSEIYSYSRAKGLYIGLSLKGAVVAPDNSANADYYGSEKSAADILLKTVGPHSKHDAALLRELRRHTSTGSWLPLTVTALAVALVAVAYAKSRAKR
ncbi:MAG: hypothetical protein MOGMAGMI_00634 [Candidatus Omnitrophica bacterium]|nr:hypothetical protein [Candidatus Omnitrophota bacterium]